MPHVKSPVQLGAVIHGTRTALHLPAADLAALAGTSAVLLRKLEQGNATIALQKLFTILDELGIEMHLQLPPEIGNATLFDATTHAKRTRVRR